MYLIYILIWIALVVFLSLLFKFLPAKMKEANDRETKNSIFTILMLFAIPLSLVIVIAPIIIIAGDENMPDKYKYIFGIVVITAIAYVMFLQKSKKEK